MATDENGSSTLGRQLLERAKTAKDQAQSSVSELAARATETATGAAGELRDQVALKASELRDAGLDKLTETLNDFNAALPVLREAGYTLSGVEIGIGLPPKVVAGFVVSDEVELEHIARIIDEHADKKFTVLLMKTMHQAWQLQARIKFIGGLKPRGLSVELGLVPSVAIQFG
jgi:hypothetical protein